MTRNIGDGFHKLGRIFLAAVTVTVLGWVKIRLPEISETELMMIASPALTYIGIKGKGYQDNNPVTNADFTD